jgi:hypothetical protein
MPLQIKHQNTHTHTHRERMGGLKSLARGLNKKAKLDAFKDAWYAAKHKEHPEKTMDQIWKDYWFDCTLAANAAGLRN